jgi:hypothetical protein
VYFFSKIEFFKKRSKIKSKQTKYIVTQFEKILKETKKKSLENDGTVITIALKPGMIFTKNTKLYDPM